jgi:hypothetical protein
LTKQCYEIQVEGLLGDRWQSWFDGLTMHHLEGSYTMLTGRMDQAMLRGVLTKISDLGLNLISVQKKDPDNASKKKEK